MSAPLPTASRWNTHSRSRYPRLWDRCVAAWCPSLGISGSRLHDYGQRMNWANLSFAPGGAYSVDGGACAFATTKGNYATSIANGPATADKAISVWYRNIGAFTANQQYAPLVYYGGGSTGAMFALILSTAASVGGNGLTAFGVGVSQFGDSVGTAQNDTNWHHVCVTNSGTTWNVYVDGVFRVSKAMTTGTFASAVYIGFVDDAIWGGAYSPNASAVVDDARIYERVPHVEEIRLLARRRAIAFEPATRPAYYTETDAGGGGVANPVLFHSYYMSQGMRP
jgi:hypothetical protein